MVYHLTAYYKTTLNYTGLNADVTIQIYETEVWGADNIAITCIY